MRPRVLFITHDLGRSGAPILLLHLLQWLRARGNLEFQILSGYGGALHEAFAAVGPTHLVHPSSSLPAGRVRRVAERLQLVPGRQAEYRAQLLRTLSAVPFDLIYVNTLACGPELAVAQEALGRACPVLCHVHELEYAIQRLGLVHTQRVFESASHYLAVSRAVRENLVVNHGVAVEQVDTVYGFVPTADPEAADRAAQRSVVRKELGLPAETAIILGAGSTEWRKGTDLFLYLARATRERLPRQPLCFVWVGGKPGEVYFEELLSDVRGLGAEAYVRLIGPRQNPQPYFRAADVFTLTSREDPFPLVALEAAAAELPIICFEGAGGTPEFVGQGCGRIVPYLDWTAMAEAVVEFLGSPELRARCGQVAAEKVRRENSIEAGARQIHAILERRLKSVRS